MGFFNKVKTQASNIGSAVSDSVGQVSGGALASSKENAKLVENILSMLLILVNILK